MGKYDPLKSFLISQDVARIPVSFADLEQVLGVKLPESKRYPAWWSNNPSNNPMTKVWLAAGYVTEQVDTAAERLVFRRAEPEPKPAEVRKGGFPGFGAMAGTARIAKGVDLTDPADPAWGDLDA